MSVKEREFVIIVGAGLSGLRTAQLLRSRHNTSSLILEATERAGGMVDTRYDERGVIKYEAGSWRVKKCHSRVLALFEELESPLRCTHTHHCGQGTAAGADGGISQWDTNALRRRNPLSADHSDLATGCAGSTHGAPYQGVESEALCDELVSDHGFSAIIEKLRDSARILYQTRVVDVRRNGTEYVVQCRCQTNGQFVNRTYSATSLFICVPPHQAQRWTIVAHWARAQINAVESKPWNQIHTWTSAPTKFHVVSPTSLLGQSVSSLHGNGWFLASSTSGRLARFWNRLRITSPIEFLRVLNEEVCKSLHLISNSGAVSSRFFEHGYHVWTPSFGFNLHKAVCSSIMPNAKHLPNVYWCGEAFSSHQGWMEGALETAEMAVAVFTRQSSYHYPRRALHGDEIAIEGRILDVASWAHVHPGGSHFINECKGGNATDHFYQIYHGTHAWSVVHALQVAVVL